MCQYNHPVTISLYIMAHHHYDLHIHISSCTTHTTVNHWLTSRIFCFWTSRLTVVRSWPTSSVTICDSISLIQPSISSTLCSYSTWRLASNRRSPLSVVVSSSSFHCCRNSSSLGSTILARSGFSPLILSPSLISFSSWSLFDLTSDSKAYNEHTQSVKSTTRDIYSSNSYQQISTIHT